MRVSELIRDPSQRREGADVEISGLTFDTRKVEPGFLFAALVGASRDGHAFVGEALARGASAVLCEREVETGNATRIVVSDSRLALAHAAQAFYGDPAAAMTTVGVTGTNGKTTTVALVQAMLEAAGRPCGVIGTLGASFGAKAHATGMTTPESVELVRLVGEMRQDGAKALAMEVSSHALAQKRADGLTFDVGVFSSFSQDHLDYHGTMDAYLAAKRRLLDELLKPHGASVLNVDDARIASLADARTLGVSLERNDSAIGLTELTLDGEGMRLVLRTPRGPMQLRSHLRGRFNVLNLMLAVGVGIALELEADAMVHGLEGASQVPGRLEAVHNKGEPQVYVDYAHTPDALEKALDAARELTRGRLICVFGCGGDRDRDKRPLMGEVAARGAEVVIVTSDNPRSEAPEAIAEAIAVGLDGAGMRRTDAPEQGGYVVDLDRRDAIRRAVALATPVDTVLVAGKGHETYQIIGARTLSFDDRVEARAALNEVRA